jgi:hypothetical protein
MKLLQFLKDCIHDQNLQIDNCNHTLLYDRSALIIVCSQYLVLIIPMIYLLDYSFILISQYGAQVLNRTDQRPVQKRIECNSNLKIPFEACA